MRIIGRFVAVCVLTLAGLGVAGPASAAVTDCSQTAGYGDRVCVDPTTVYGPLVQIFTPGGTYWNAFPVSLVGWDCAETAIGHGSWFGVGSAGAVGACNTAGGYSHTASIGNFSSGGAVAFTNNATYDSWMVWFGNAAAYPTMELLTVT